MSQHDYDIANQTAAAARSDINLALKALASNSSGASAPSTTYANQLWYDTANDQLKQRNESNSAWITLGTVDQTNSKFDPNFTPATTAEAQAGTNNTKVMTPLRVEEYTLANDIGWSQTWQDVTADRSSNVTYQNTTGRPIMVRAYMQEDGQLQVSVDGTTWLVLWTADADTDAGAVGGGFIIPNGHYYRGTATRSGSGWWLELR